MTKKKDKEAPTKKEPNAKERVNIELIELVLKIDKLLDFKKSKKYYALSKSAQRLVRIQLLDMQHYAQMLKSRLDIW